MESVSDEQLALRVSEGSLEAVQRVGDLCREASQREALQGCVGPLCALLNDSNRSLELREQCARGLANLCFEHAANRAAAAAAASSLCALCPARPAVGCLANLLSLPDTAAALCVAAGALQALLLSLPAQPLLAARALLNAFASADAAAAVLQCDALPALVTAVNTANDNNDEEATQTAIDALEALLQHEDCAVAAVERHSQLFVQLAAIPAAKDLLASLCDSERLRGPLCSPDFWRAAPLKCRALLSADDRATALALRETEEGGLLDFLRTAQSDEERVAGLMILGNAARSEDSVLRLLRHAGVVEEAVRWVKEGTTNIQHLALGLLGNLSVPQHGRQKVVECGGLEQAVATLQSSNNAHVMFASASLIRRLCLLGEQAAQRVPLDALLGQRERLHQPEHQRIWTELSRAVGILLLLKLARGEQLTEAQRTTATDAVLGLLKAEWGLLRLEGCRAAVALSGRAELTEALLKLTGKQEEGPTRLAAALALKGSEHYKTALEELQKDTDTLIDGVHLNAIAAQLAKQ